MLNIKLLQEYLKENREEYEKIGKIKIEIEEIRLKVGETKEIEYTMENMKNVVAEELVSDSTDNTTAKGFCVIAETDKAYYTCAITGEQKDYNRNIEHLKTVLSAFVEK